MCRALLSIAKYQKNEGNEERRKEINKGRNKRAIENNTHKETNE
jgi:hypothetical protein